MNVSLIVAYADNRVIGIDNQLPWHLPEDLKHFKAVTLGKPIIMGRKTWESLGRPLPGRMNIVITRNDEYSADGATVVDSLETAIAVASYQAQQDMKDEVMIIGGATIYEQALKLVDTMYITQVHIEPEGDAFFIEFNQADWMVESEEKLTSVKGIQYSLLTYKRLADDEVDKNTLGNANES